MSLYHAIPSPNINDMESPRVAALLLTLEEMVKGYQRLLTVLQREKALIIEGNINDLTFYLREKGKLMEEIRRLEETRCHQAAALAPSDSVPTLRQLMDIVPSSYQEQFSSCAERLRALSASVMDLNQINGLLSSRILQHVHALLNLLTHLSTTPVYQASGSFHCESQKGYAKPAGLFYLQG